MRLFVPGRICLLGEHSDWAGGYRRDNASILKGHTIVCGTNQGVSAQVQKNPGALLLSSTAVDGRKIGPYTIPMEPERLLEEAQRGGFWSYIAGVAFQIQRMYHVDGLHIDNDYTDLPIQKGLSSSAAICVLTARAFNQQYRLGLSLEEEMELAYLGEVTTPSRCGRMDQACAYGAVPVLLTFDADRMTTAPLQVGADLHLVVVDLCAHKDTRKILTSLNGCYPFAHTEIQRNVQHLFGEGNRTTVYQAAEAIARGDAPALGQLMQRAQQDFDRWAVPICPDELTAPVLHHVLEHPVLQPYIWGGKGVGSQGDGSAQLLARGPAAQAEVLEILQDNLQLPGIALTIAKNTTQ